MYVVYHSMSSCTKQGNVWKVPKQVRQELRPSKNGNTEETSYIYINTLSCKKNINDIKTLNPKRIKNMYEWFILLKNGKKHQILRVLGGMQPA
jgi:hypothetical protein